MKKVFTLLLATVLFSSVAGAKASLTAYKGSASDYVTVTTADEWNAILAEYPNAIAYGEDNADNEAIYNNCNNVVLRFSDYDAILEDYNYSYKCRSLKLTDPVKFAEASNAAGSPEYMAAAAKCGFYAPYDFTAVSVSYERDLVADYNSVCVPFAISDGFTDEILSFSSYDIANNNAYFGRNAVASAGIGVIIRPAAAMNWKVNLSNVDIKAQPYENSIQGTFVKTGAYAGFYSVNTDVDNVFSPLANDLYPFRACFKVQSANGAAPRMVILGSEEATKLDAINANAADAKFMQNGKLMIRHNGQVFDAAGKIVK